MDSQSAGVGHAQSVETAGQSRHMHEQSKNIESGRQTSQGSSVAKGGRVPDSVLQELQAKTGVSFDHEVFVAEAEAEAREPAELMADVTQRTTQWFPSLAAFMGCQSLSGHTLLQPTRATAEAMLRQYTALKLASAVQPTAVVVMPVGVGLRWKALVKGWQWVHSFSMQDAQGRTTRWAAWWDKPKPQLRVNAVTRAGLTMQFTGQAAGMQVHMLADTGASDVFVTRALLLRAGVKEFALKQAESVQVGDGSAAQCQGMCVLPIRIKGYQAKVKAYVLDTTVDGFDLVLGESWLKPNGVVLDYARKTMVFKQGSKMHVLRAHAGPGSSQAQPTHRLLSAMQMKRELRKATRRGDRVFLASLTRTEEPEPGPISTAPDQPSVAPDGLMEPEKVQALITEFSDVFPAELPAGEPPDRGVTHAIPTIPGAKPPARPMYRLSPREMEEARKQVQELLAKGLVQPSTSPYAAPIMFVAKADGSLRMVQDYRPLNAITVKNQFPLPRIDDLLDSLNGARVFSSLDLQSGFHQIRIPEEDRHKTAFRVPGMHLEFKVLSMGLVNAPGTFQACMTRVFGDLINRPGSGVLVYLDDILVYSRTAAEHEQMLRTVLQRLREHKLYAKLKKCEFNMPELKFLGHIVGREGIKPDPAKVKVVQDWPTPRTATELRSFLGLANYFRRFMNNYSKHVGPLLALTTGTLAHGAWPEGTWGAAQETAFQWIKQALTTAPTLTTPDLSKSFVVMTDASVEGIGAVLMQDGKPVAYESRRLIPAETRYTTTEQEMLAVVHALKMWRCFLEGGARFTIKTDHNPNTYFSTKPTLSRREARWSEFLQQFDFEWQYVKGATNTVADPLSRLPGQDNSQVQDTQAKQKVLGMRFKQQVLTALTRHKAVATGAELQAGLTRHRVQQKRKTPEPDASDAPQARQAQQAQQEQQPAKSRATTKRKGQAAAAKQDQQSAPAVATPQRGKGKSAHDPASRSPALLDRIRAGYADDSWYQDQAATSALGLQHRNGLWWKDGRVAVPGYKAYTEAILWDAHDSPAAGHGGLNKTLARVRSQWWWPTLEQDVRDYVQACASCQLNKSGRRNRGLLQPLQIPTAPWDSVSMDWITSLPRTPAGLDCILVMVDRLTKMVHLCPCKSTDKAPDTARHFVHHVWRLHGLPTAIVSDRDPRFTSAFWQEVCRITGCKQHMSTAFHPQSDGQTERMNRTLEDVLRHYVGNGGADWAEHLDAAEYAINTSWQESVQETPFFLNYGRHPNSVVGLAARMAMPERSPAAKAFVASMQEAIARAKDCLRRAQDRQKATADKKRTDSWTPAAGDKVLLHTKNIKLKGCKKLMPTWLGPFAVSEAVNAVAFRLSLPASMRRVHPVFHVGLLKPWHEGAGQKAIKPPPIEVDEEGDVFAVERILAHRDVKVASSKAKGKKQAKARMQRQYLIKWVGYEDEQDNTWEPESNIVGGAQELLSDYWAGKQG